MICKMYVTALANTYSLLRDFWLWLALSLFTTDSFLLINLLVKPVELLLYMQHTACNMQYAYCYTIQHKWYPTRKGENISNLYLHYNVTHYYTRHEWKLQLLLVDLFIHIIRRKKVLWNNIGEPSIWYWPQMILVSFHKLKYKWWKCYIFFFKWIVDFITNNHYV